MTELLRIFIPGKVSGKGRPRFARMGNFVRAYTPKETENAEGIIRTMAMQQLAGRPPSTAPIYLQVVAMLMPPQSWPNWKRVAAFDGNIEATTKPDLDNIMKLVKDALNKVVWADDAQVVICHASKGYGVREGVEIYVSERAFMTAQNAKRAA